MTGLAVASISARMLAEAARGDGFDVAAFDLFGDADTRRASTHWQSIGEAASLEIDGARLLQALEALAQGGRTAGWIAGAGFEGCPELLARGAALLPLIGTGADAMRRVRDPRCFFDVLDAHGIGHPAVRTTAPEDADGWLLKDAHGCGGWHIRRAAEPDAAAWVAAGSGHRYFQRELPGRPMSATFVANGSDAAVLGFNQLIVRPVAGRPFVFCGAVGPVPLPAAVAQRIVEAVRTLARGFALRGLGSLDFMLDGDTAGVLEVNPRPPASMALYGGRGGLVAAHVRACIQGVLPRWPAQAPGTCVHGTEVVFAPRRLWLDEEAARRLAGDAGRHDLPAAATAFEAGDPLCSVSADGADAQAVHASLARHREAVHRSLETCA